MKSATTKKIPKQSDETRRENLIRLDAIDLWNQLAPQIYGRQKQNDPTEVIEIISKFLGSYERQNN